MAEPDVWHTMFARFAPRFLEIASRGPNAVELAAAIRRSHPGCDPWKTARILGAVVDALEAGHQPTTRQIVDNLDRAGERVSLALVKATVARAQCIGLRTEACASCRTSGGLPRRRCEYRAADWTAETLLVTSDREVFDAAEAAAWEGMSAAERAGLPRPRLAAPDRGADASPCAGETGESPSSSRRESE